MRNIGKIISVILSLALLSSCTVNVSNEDVTLPGVTIETYKPSTSASKTETEPAVTTEPTVTTLPVTTEPLTSSDTTEISTEASTEPSEAETSVSSVSKEETEAYFIVDSEGIMYAISGVNVRQKPDADSKRVGHLDKGDQVKVTGIVSNGWMRIKFKDGEYFVNGRYLTEFYEEEITTTATTVETALSTITTTVTTATSATTTEYISDEEIIEDELSNVVIDTNSYTALNYAEQKAVWFAYLDIDTMLSGADEASFRAKFSQAMDEVRFMGCNTVYVHVRAFGDAYYDSDYYAFAASYSGKMGGKCPFDPLEIMIEEAHKRGLSFHAWINPMRTTTKNRYKEMSSDYTLKKWYNSSSANGTYLVYNYKTEYYWLSPAYPAVRELICNGVAELVSNYDVDAIHIDDYFYPTTSASFDEEAYKASGTKLTLSEWRRNVVSILVKEMYSTVKACNSTVLFGVSPAGNTKNNYESYYADIYTWCSNKGYMDYIVPQIYYGYEDKLPFDTTALEWQGIVSEPSIKLVCGIAAYKVGLNDEWSTGSILKKQTDFINALGSYSGCAYYRYGTIFAPSDDVGDLMMTELLNLIA